MNEERDKLNRVYGRGFHDGMKAAGIQIVKESAMNEAKFNALFRSLSEQAKKVYQAVPMNEKWSTGQVMTELARTVGQREHRVVAGCLRSLMESGLIKEPDPGMWIRVEIRPRVASVSCKTEIEETVQEMPKKETKDMPPINTQPTPQKADTTPLERIGGLSAQVLSIIQSLHQLAADIEAAALEVEEQIEKINKDGEKLKQLQQLLKSLS